MRPTAATAYLPMTPVRTANCILMLMLGIGLAQGDFSGRESHADMHLVVGLLIGYLCFLWCRSDSDARGFRRPRVLGAAMVLLPLVALPYYLLRSRGMGQRGPALGAFAGLLLAMPLALWIGIGIRLAILNAAS